ncbi:MAG: DNA/RNA nuclease SfsA [Candidatus Bathyarchaeia archaeon]
MGSYIKIGEQLHKGTFRRRLTRFSAIVQIYDETVICYLPNPGRLLELLIPDAEVILNTSEKATRRTRYNIVGVRFRDQFISLDSRIPNKLVYEALKNGDLSEFTGYAEIKPEPLYNNVRFDFLLSDAEKQCLLEVKSCTLVKNGTALFPDAPTKRGAKHMLELAKAKGEGYRACVLFIIQREDANIFRPNDEVDRKFGNALRFAKEHGVEVYAYSSKFMDNKIMLNERIEVSL